MNIFLIRSRFCKQLPTQIHLLQCCSLRIFQNLAQQRVTWSCAKLNNPPKTPKTPPMSIYPELWHSGLSLYHIALGGVRPCDTPPGVQWQVKAEVGRVTMAIKNQGATSRHNNATAQSEKVAVKDNRTHHKNNNRKSKSNIQYQHVMTLQLRVPSSRGWDNAGEHLTALRLLERRLTSSWAHLHSTALNVNNIYIIYYNIIHIYIYIWLHMSKQKRA